jgi:glycosyltransferase involved in cell wall biosynthesis
LKIFVLGTRGIPDIQGGVEQHCENLYPLIASKEYQITLFRRNPFITNKDLTYSNISFIDLPSSKVPGLEALFHSFLCSMKCLFSRPDIVHIHNIGPGFFVPLLKMAGLKVIMTYHSPNYEHLKWSVFTRHFLKMSEFLSTRFSDKVIFVSLYQKNKLGNKENYVHINNGVKFNPLVSGDDYINLIGLQKKEYILSVGRFVEEKGFDLLINAFSRIRRKDLKLVIAGDSDHETNYSVRLRNLAREHNVILPGYVRGEKLQQLYNNARLFVLPSYNEGMPLSLLEAMSYQLPVLASNIPANLQVSLPADSYFVSGDEESLRMQLNLLLQIDAGSVVYDLTPYDWNQVALETKKIYKGLMNGEMK